MQKRVEILFEKIAKQFGLPVEVVKAIYDAQCMCTREKMSKGEKGKIETYLNIRWPNWGSYIVKPARLAAIHRNNANNNKSQEDI
jgi:hypothetical protein